MNQVATLSQFPAHLQALAQKTGLAANITAGIIAGAQFHSIGIKAARWRLISPQGEEVVQQTHHLDVIILDGNPNLSRRFYLSAYDPSGETKAPDCFSDNGVGPSVRSSKPQCGTCAACPHNVLGSKVNPNGSKSKACSDAKTLAVILADNPDGPVYQLQVPHMSQKNLKAFVDLCNAKGAPLAVLVVRLTFDTSADYPLITFTPQSYASPEQAAAVEDLIGSEEVDLVTNKNDTPIDATKFAPPTGGASSAANLPAQAVAQAAPVQEAPVAAAPTRKRRTKAEIVAAAPVQEAPVTASVAPVAPSAPSNGFFAGLQEKAKPAAQVVTNPQPTGAALDDLLAAAFKV